MVFPGLFESSLQIQSFSGWKLCGRRKFQLLKSMLDILIVIFSVKVQTMERSHYQENVKHFEDSTDRADEYFGGEQH